MQSFKILSSKRLRRLMPVECCRKFEESGEFRLWKPRFDELTLTSEDQFRVKLNYVHENPVRAGLVSRPEEWSLSSASEWSTGVPGILPVSRDFSWMKRD